MHQLISFFGRSEQITTAGRAARIRPRSSLPLFFVFLDRPIFITIKQATGLQGSSAKPTPDPLVIVTLLGDIVEKDEEEAGDQEGDDSGDDSDSNESDDCSGENRQHWQVLTPVAKSTISPQWDNKILLPAVSSSMMVLFTCIDWEGGSNTFLGQSCLRLAETGHFTRAESIVLPLAEFENALCPRDGAGKPMEFQAVAANGCGEIDVMIAPCDPATSFACDAKTTENALSRWVRVTNRSLCLRHACTLYSLSLSLLSIRSLFCSLSASVSASAADTVDNDDKNGISGMPF